MGTQEVKLDRVGEKSMVDGLDLICSFIHIDQRTWTMATAARKRLSSRTSIYGT